MIEVFIPRFINKTMDLIVSKDTHQVIFGPVEQDREYSMVMAGVTKSGWGKKSKRICVRTYQACKCLISFETENISEGIVKYKCISIGN